MSDTWEVPANVRAAAATVRTRLPRELVEQALARYDAGLWPKAIANELAIHQDTVTCWLRDAGLTRGARGCPGEPRLPTGEFDRRLRALRDHGTIRGAARALGIPYSSLRWWAVRNAPDLVRGTPAPDTTPQGGPTLPVEPLAMWLDEQLARGAVVEDMADAAGLSARRLNAVARREFATVSVHVADRLLTGNGSTLALVYEPEALAA